jgi:hypothetical protein
MDKITIYDVIKEFDDRLASVEAKIDELYG